MKLTTSIDIFDDTNQIVTTFKRYENNNNTIFWKQDYNTQVFRYEETIIDNNNVTLFNENSNILITYNPCCIFMPFEGDKKAKMFPDCTLKLSHVDDNTEIMKLLHDRLALGKERYGHGVRVDDDTTQWGTDTDSWETMMMEEALDGMIYAAASLLRIKRRREKQ